jgi:hypothetical protein
VILLVAGELHVDGRAFIANGGVAFYDFEEDAPALQETLIAVISEHLSAIELRRLLYFATASDALPVPCPEGYLRFTFTPSASVDALLVAHTCFRSVEVAPMSDTSVEAVKAKMLQSIEYGLSGTFDR